MHRGESRLLPGLWEVQPQSAGSNFSAGGTTQSAGFISTYDLDTGRFVGLLEDENGKPISINGIWSISVAKSATPNSYDPGKAPASELYFTAGPNQARVDSLDT